VLETLSKDKTILKIFANLDLLSIEDANQIYSIFKHFILCGLSKKNEKIEKYLIEHLVEIETSICENFYNTYNDTYACLAAKILRKFFRYQVYTLSISKHFYSKMLTFPFFRDIYNLAKTEKFLLAKEIFTTIFAMIDGDKMNKNIFINFLNINKKEFCELICNTINVTGSDEIYFVTRETLIMLKKILKENNGDYIEFRDYFLNQIQHLKTIMIQLNSDCEKIKQEALFILSYFFEEIENKQITIKKVIFKNKDNFYKLFEVNQKVFNETSEMEEIQNCILYELERLSNLIND
jgi:hypothetical protein